MRCVTGTARRLDPSAASVRPDVTHDWPAAAHATTTSVAAIGERYFKAPVPEATSGYALPVTRR